MEYAREISNDVEIHTIPAYGTNEPMPDFATIHSAEVVHKVEPHHSNGRVERLEEEVRDLRREMSCLTESVACLADTLSVLLLNDKKMTSSTTRAYLTN